MPLSPWDDYSDDLNPDTGDSDSVWAYTEFGADNSKWAPFTHPALDHLANSVVASIELAASADGKTANIQYGDRALFNIPPRPYLAAHVGFELAKKHGFKPLIPLEPREDMEFRDRIAKGFANALNDRVDILISMTSVLKRVAKRFNPNSVKSSSSSGPIKKVNAKGIVEIHGRQMAMESAVGVGTAFRLQIHDLNDISLPEEPGESGSSEIAA